MLLAYFKSLKINIFQLKVPINTLTSDLNSTKLCFLFKNELLETLFLKIIAAKLDFKHHICQTHQPGSKSGLKLGVLIIWMTKSLKNIVI